MSEAPEPMAISGTMPNVIGDTLSAAETAITAASDGGTPSYSVSYHPGGGTPGTVMSTNPAAGASITDEVTIVVYSRTP